MSLNDTDTYLDLVTSLYRGQPKFMTLCLALIEPLVGQQALLEDVRAGFDLDSAVGVQLDHVGQWVGRTRDLETPIADAYFSWEAEGVGWDEGTWKGPYDPDFGLVALPDDAYRTLLRAKIAANSWDGTIPGAYEVWGTVFGESGSIVVIQDNQDMSIVVGLAGARTDPVTMALLTGGYIPLKPEGVRIEHYAVAPEGGRLFAWGCDSEALGGWDEGSWPEIVTP